MISVSDIFQQVEKASPGGTIDNLQDFRTVSEIIFTPLICMAIQLVDEVPCLLRHVPLASKLHSLPYKLCF